MENYPPTFSYPDSGDSSPNSNSRETDFENPPPSWDDQQQQSNSKVKLMVSYGGKIQPRSYDNLLSYVGGDTKIMGVDRGVKFSTLHSKLSTLLHLSSSSASFKYQLPGEDLDALISVTNDDDLDHMMHEYDRLSKASSKPPRLRLFLFPNPTPSPPNSTAFSSESPHFLASHPDSQPHPHPHQVNHFNQNDVVLDPPTIASPPPPPPLHNDVDFLFGLDNKVPIPVQLQTEPDLVQEMNRVQISPQEFHHFQQQQQQQPNISAVYSTNASDENAPTPTNMQMPAAAAYWQQQNHQQQQQQQFLQQQMYMMQAPPQGGMYQPPVVMPSPANQGYYQVQRMPSDPNYVAQPVYSVPAAVQVRPGESAGGYAQAQVAYDTVTGMQFYYPVAPPQYNAMSQAATAAVGGDGRSSGDGKVSVQNVSVSSAAV